MNMDCKDKEKHPFKAPSVIRSFSYAGRGILSAFRTERNIRIHFTMAILVVILGAIFHISRMEWLIIIVVIGGMIALELINTAIERIVDLVTTEFHPLAKEAKDIAAGAVFIYALLSVLVGLIIFLPKLF